MNATAFYQKLAGHNLITTREAAQLTGLSIPAASMALRLAVDGLSTPLKKGHWLIGPFSSKPGALVTAAAAPYQAYLSGWPTNIFRSHFAARSIPSRFVHGLLRIKTARHGEPEKPGK